MPNYFLILIIFFLEEDKTLSVAGKTLTIEHENDTDVEIEHSNCPDGKVTTVQSKCELESVCDNKKSHATNHPSSDASEEINPNVIPVTSRRSRVVGASFASAQRG